MNQQEFNEIFNRLTPRRKEVLQLTLAGEPDATISKSLEIEQTTVRKHIERLCHEFGVQRRTELIALFAREKPELLSDYTPEELLATNEWYLERLYADLEEHGYKQTPTMNARLRGLLLGLTTEEIAQELQIDQTTVSVSLSEQLAPAIKSLLNIQLGKINWSRIPELLKRAGYYRGQQDAVPEPNLYYVERPEIESCCRKEISKPGCLLRIYAPWKMGKTILLNKILRDAKKQGYRTVFVDFRMADKEVFRDLDKLLKWLCACIGKDLQEQRLPLELPDKLEDYWDATFGSKVSCTDFFEKTFLAKINKPLVLALDDVSRVYQNNELPDDFFDLLRGWREEATRRDIWKKLRTVITYSRNINISSMYLSLFNVGYEIELPEFEPDEIIDLAKQYGLDWDEDKVKKVTMTVGGHPYLVQEALNSISRGYIEFDEFCEKAPTNEGIYGKHLAQHVWTLQKNPKLAKAMKEVVDAKESVPLNPDEAFILHSMGLVKLEVTRATPSCQMYRQYFQKYLIVNQ
ncbi:AAA-like domain-containing protein [Aerosakkonema funiforme]|uniref:AAA-like domain-containing protein n=1 Tax=Aerosakkonema funiforme TaxID=1246630 RepID=UPI0035BBAAC0